MDRKGTLFVVSAPSGAGKTSLCRSVSQEVANLRFSISCTTRSPRPGEVHGKDYFFIDRTDFRKRIECGDFVEWAEVHGNLYGTSRKELSQWTDQGVDVILDIDSQGAMILKKCGGDEVFIYILPPSYEILKKRLINRGADSGDEILRRLRNAREEVACYKEYHYLIVNKVFEEACKNMASVILAERLRMRGKGLSWMEETLIRPFLEASETGAYSSRETAF